MKVVAVVPMKLNSQRLPNKNILQFTNGAPLCRYVLTTLLSVKEIEEVYVYCSNPKIQDYVPEQVKYLPRSQTLDTDETKMNEVLKCFAKEIPADIYVMTHTTAPFITAGSIRNGLSAVMERKNDSAFAVKKIQDFLWKDGRPLNYDLKDIPRTQDLPPLFEETSGFYIYTADVINRMGRRIGERPHMVEVSAIESVDIDEKEDFEIADALYNYMKSKAEIN